MMTLWSGGGGGREGVLIKHQKLKFVLPPWRDLSPFPFLPLLTPSPLPFSSSSSFPTLLFLVLPTTNQKRKKKGVADLIEKRRRETEIPVVE